MRSRHVSSIECRAISISLSRLLHSSFRPTGPTSGSTTNAPTSEDEEEDEERAVRGGEAYAPSDTAKPDASATQAREETIWQLYLRWMLEGEVDGSLGNLKRWNETNARDCEQLRRDEEQSRREEEEAKKRTKAGAERRARM